MAATSVLVTRPAGQQGALVEALESAGFSTHHAPLIEVCPFDEPDAQQRSVLLGLCDFQHVIFVSRNAIRHGMNWIDDHWPQHPVGIHWYTVGDSSARLLSDYGLQALTPDSEMSSEGLLRLPSLDQVDDQRVLIIKGEGGRTLLRDTLESRGARVEELAVYRRTVPSYAPGELVERLLGCGCELVLLSSGEGLHNMVSLLDDAALEKAHQLTLVVPGERVAEQARELGFDRVAVAANATDEAMVAAARAAAGMD